MPAPTHEEIRETINRSGCDLFAFFDGSEDTGAGADDRCYMHSISHRDTELLAVDIRREDAPAIAGLMTDLMKRWGHRPMKPGESCLALGCNLMLSVTEPDEANLDRIMEEMVGSAVAYRGNKDFAVLVLVPARRLSDEAVKQILVARQGTTAG